MQDILSTYDETKTKKVQFWRREIGELIKQLLAQIPAFKDSSSKELSDDPMVQIMNLCQLIQQEFSMKQKSDLVFMQDQDQ